MKAAVLHGKEDLRYEDWPVPEPKDDEVLVKVRAAGICGSDIPRVLGDGAHDYPIILGHEFSGEVVAVGPNAQRIAVGTRVAGVPLIPCHECVDCLLGQYSQCKHYTFIGSRIQGAFAEYVALPERNVVPFDDNVSFEQGALFEPATIGLHGLECVRFRGAADVAILGGGTIGLFTAQWAKIYGARRVFVFDIDDDRLALGRKLGVEHTFNTMSPGFKEQAVAATAGRGFGYVFETAGVDITMKLAFELAGNKAKICFIGTPTKELVFDPKLFEQMNRKEFTLTGSWMSYSAPFPGKEWELTAHFFNTGQLKYDEGMVFRRFPLSRAAEAFALYKVPGVVKGKIILVNE